MNTAARWPGRVVSVNSRAPWAQLGSEPISTGTPVIGIAVAVKLAMPSPEDSPTVATVEFEIAGNRYGPIKVPVPVNDQDAHVPTDAINDLDIPDDTDVAVRLVAITAPFEVDQQRNVIHSTLGTLLHHIK